MKFYPYEEGGGSLSHAEGGGAEKVLGSVSILYNGGGGCNNLYTVFRGGGGKQFPFCKPPSLKLMTSP